MEEIITPSQVAAVLLVNVKTVYRLAKKGAIPDNKIGCCWRFIKKDVLDLVSNGLRKLKGGAQRQGARGGGR